MELEIKHIQKKFRKKEVLQDIILQADPGTCIGILGANGCGKSTLLSILAGVLPADGGSFCWREKDLLKDEKLRQRILGYVPQGTPLLQELTALDNLKLWYSGCERDLKKDLKEGVPAMMGVTEFLRVPVRKMSGGMKKRLSISCAVANNPRVLLMDEPSAALDLVCKERIRNYILDFKARGGILLLTTHEESELDLCDRWYIMREGQLTPYSYDGNVHHLAGQLQR